MFSHKSYILRRIQKCAELVHGGVWSHCGAAEGWELWVFLLSQAPGWWCVSAQKGLEVEKGVVVLQRHLPACKEQNRATLHPRAEGRGRLVTHDWSIPDKHNCVFCSSVCWLFSVWMTRLE